MEVREFRELFVRDLYANLALMEICEFRRILRINKLFVFNAVRSEFDSRRLHQSSPNGRRRMGEAVAPKLNSAGEDSRMEL